MAVDVPRTATEAAPVLVATWDVDGNPTARALPGENLAELDPWEALTRSHAMDAPGRGRASLAARHAAATRAWRAREGVRDGLPPVVVALPLPYLPRGWAQLTGDPSPAALTDDGYAPQAVPYRVGPIASPVRPKGRPRLAVVADLEGLPPRPRTSHALAVAVLACRSAADAVEAWRGLTADDARRVQAEAAAYRDYAAAAEAQLGPSFAWLQAVPQTPRPAFPVVPARPWGTARPGTT